MGVIPTQRVERYRETLSDRMIRVAGDRHAIVVRMS
jgi:hypothetical protein